MTAGRASRALETFYLGLAIACVGERCCLLCGALACLWTPMSFVLALVSRQLGRCLWNRAGPRVRDTCLDWRWPL
ncbi:hypothetical protein XFF6990_200291 [Xanthomonas citri pv. fuscans]|nr:hypothetical protein XFF6990_200291 [Xanthomonas citri pv. fuscans]